MSKKFQKLLSQRTLNMQSNAIREILAVVSQPGMISLAGGIPAPQSFPLEDLYRINETVLDRYGAAALQYDLTEGFTPFREALVDYLSAKQVQTSAEDILVFNGSQSVLDTLAKVLITPGDFVALESPSYLGAITAFNAYEPRYVDIETDDEGIIPESLVKLLEKRSVKFIYLVSTFQNPTGRTLSASRRREVAEIVKRFEALVIEDDPYSDLRYRGEPIAPFFTFAPENTVYVSTVSKVFAPGLRLGFCIAPKAIHHWMRIAKQGADLHSNTYAQALATEYIRGGYLDRQLPKIIDLYRPRQEAMLAAMDEFMPKVYRWTKPEGGMFIWIDGPDGLDAEEIYWKAVDQKVAFVPGKYFFIDQKAGLGTMRLNFTMSDESTIVRAIEILARVIGEHSGD
ncbi:MAG: PLP-dependent aminotransferase family protein [Chloroflexi bacterium]|nr:PLP-dependent aminotransferase family protein [Chloroflexota bacterium]